jgi:NitT/TauT family transport system ATP-binding protein
MVSASICGRSPEFGDDCLITAWPIDPMMPPAETKTVSTSAAPIVSLRDIGKTFANGTHALDHLDLDIRQGEFLSLLGPSGCGKSTVLRLIAGLAAQSRGTMSWAGAGGSPLSGREATRDIGFVFQEPTLMPWARVAANVALPLSLRGLDAQEASSRACAMIDRVGLGGFADTYPRELSGGMKMRVAIARALVTSPALLLMDEPFAALDEITRLKLNNDLLDLWLGLGSTVVFVTHSVFESVYLSNRIVVMAARPGRVIADIAIDAPYPRDNSYRTSTTYAEYCRTTSDALARAIGNAR